MAFTPAQKKEMDRLDSSRIQDKNDLASPGVNLKNLEKYTDVQLRGRVNILSISDTINFAPENNYTAQEQAYIEAAQPRTKWMIAVPELLERATILEADGLTPTTIVEILRG